MAYHDVEGLQRVL